MSVAGISQDHPDRNILKKSFHRRNDSGELDVFEAARYFSGYSEAVSYSNGSSFNHHHHHHHHQKMMKEDNRSWRGGRISLDMPIRHHALNPQNQPHHHNQVANIIDHSQMSNMIKDKKYKQPSSPGGRLASFLNSLFNQSALKKKKSKSSSMKDDLEDSPGGIRRKRRSSISHFRSSSTTITSATSAIIAADSKSIYSSSSSGFRTPPAYAQTPSKSYKEFKSFAKKNNTTSTTTRTNNDDEDDHKGLRLLEEKSTSSEEKKLGLFRSFDEERDHGDNDDDDDDDGADSDSSSDLFELQNYDLGSYSSGLPVYETTNMDKIKRGSAPISNASM